MSKSIVFESEIIPSSVKAGERIRIKCFFKGKLRFGFFDVAMLDNEGNQAIWMPDRGTWNSYRDTGTLSGTAEFSTEWVHYIPDWIPEGEYTFQVLVFDDKHGKNIGRRIPVVCQDHRLKILSSTHEDAKFIRKLYNTFLKREPDLFGYRTWFDNLQLKNAAKRQVLEVGFLRCLEFRLRFIHELIEGREMSPQSLSASINKVKRKSLQGYIKERYELKDVIQLGESVISFLNLNNVAKQELRLIIDNERSVEEKLVSIISNFLIEKFILIKLLFPRASATTIQKNVLLYLSDPEEIISHI